MRQRGFYAWGIETGPFAACSADFVTIFFQVLIFILELPFLITTERGNEKNGLTQKWMRQRGFYAWGIETGPFAACSADFVTKNFHLFTMPPIIIPTCQFLLPQREEG